MPQLSDTERQRRFTPKVKTGCFSCRRRRIKCPEQFPVCQRCELAKLACEYPSNAKANITKRAAAAAAEAASTSSSAAGTTPSSTASAQFALTWPPALAAPEGVTLGVDDADLFGTFCSSIVHASSGLFNKEFWQVDVPRAAVTYPAVWHASIALAAIHMSVRKSSSTPDGEQHALTNAGTGTDAGAGTGKPLYNSSSPHNRQYLLALAHFHKSIQHLATALQARRGCLSYNDQEMVILTNILFFGITGMLEDPQQIQSHYKNLFLLLQSFRFGDADVDDGDSDSPGNRGRDRDRDGDRGRGGRRGIMDQDELRSVVLALEGSYPYVAIVAPGLDSDWVVKIPSYEAFASITEAYTEFLIILHGRLRRRRPRRTPTGSHAPEGPIAALREVTLFEAKILAFEQSAAAADTLDQTSRDAIEYMRRHMQVGTIRLRASMRTRRQDVIEDEQEFVSVLDYLERELSKSSSPFFPSSSSPLSYPSPPSSLSSPPTSCSASSPSPPSSSCSAATAAETPPFVFSTSFGHLLEILIFQTSSLAIKNRALDLIRKWPYKEGGSRSEESIAYVEAAIAHELDGPARTRPFQLAGRPILPTFANGGLEDREFDGTRECECLHGLFVCREHRMGDYRLDSTSKRPSHEFASKYEVRCGLPYTRYYF